MGNPTPSMALVEPVLAGAVPAIARLITRAEVAAEECLNALGKIYQYTGKAHIVGITGVPGSGKSTLVAKLCQATRRSDRRVGVVAVDPSSPFTGGAILGDRVRMNDLACDPGIFVRSMATRGALGGLARATLSAVDILDAAGFDLVLIETVGVGQDEVDVVQAAHTIVVVSAPGLGDDIQAIKAGILEIADIHVVSKCDRPDANKTVVDLKAMLTMTAQLTPESGWQVPVIPTNGLTGGGMEALLSCIDEHLEVLKASGELEARRQRIAEARLLKSAENILRDEFENHREGKLSDLTRRLSSGEIHPYAAARTLLDQIWSEMES
ncbi:MAG: methylmalonyl Co-A mutase-associated GTPase MeaB [Nitrospiraceae bacterium]